MTKSRNPILDGASAAEIDGRCRYSLFRGVSSAPFVLFIGLNPSTADAVKNDSTVRIAAAFTRAWQYSAFYIGNVSPIRATKPRDMRALLPHTADELSRNRMVVHTLAERAAIVVACWGNIPQELTNEARTVLYIANDAQMKLGNRVMRLGPATKSGHPHHPLRLSLKTKLEPHTVL